MSIKIITFLFSLLAFVNVQAAVDLSWLVSQQNPDGSFTAQNDIGYQAQNASEVLQTLHLLGDINLVDENLALQIINLSDLAYLENIARGIVAYKNAGIDASVLVAQLKLFINEDGGFGSRIGYQSTVLDTALAVRALAVSGSLLDDDFSYAVSYLIDFQNADGSWAGAGNLSSVYITTSTSLALFKAQTTFNVTDKINAANAFLIDHIQNNIADIETFEVALAVLSIAPTTSDKVPYTFLVDRLLQTRDVDGSWTQDIYTTALAMRALYLNEQVVPVNEDLSSVVTSGSSISAVTGVITDGLSGQVLSGAIVSVTTADGNNTNAVTDVDGRYAISNLFPGSASISVDLAGYHTATAAPVLLAGVIHRFNPALALQPQPLPLNISGSVVDEATGLPLAGVSVQAVNSSVATFSSTTGDFSLNNLSPGSITILVTSSGYISRSYTVSSASGGNVDLGDVTLTPGTSSNNPATLTGVITDAISAQPLNGVLISLSGMDSQSAFSDVNGLFTINNINSGDLNITAILTGYVDAVSNVNIETGINAQFNVTLVKVNNQAQVTMQGTVVDNDTLLPLSGVEISIIDQSLSVLTNVDGTFQVGGIIAGTLNIKLSHDDYQDTLYTITAEKSGLVNLGQISLLLKSSLNTPGVMAIANVPGSSNIWLAGMPDGATSIGDVAPDQSPVLFGGLDLNVGALSFVNVSGGVRFVPGCIPETGAGCSPPDGASGFVNHSGGASNGISGVRAPNDALVGVFLDDAQPDGTPAPVTLDFESIGTDFASLAPELKQVFFIGDGLTGTGSGEIQQFSIPNGATRLFVGTIDQFGWYDNSGLFSVSVTGDKLTGKPDLLVDSLSVDNVSTNLQTLRVNGSASIGVKNIGVALVEAPALVTVFEDSNANKLYDIDIDNVLGETTVFLGLAKDDVLDVNVPLSGAVAFRDSPIYVMVDSDLKIVESDETNNVGNTMALCQTSVNAPNQTLAPLSDVTASLPKVNGGVNLSSSISVRVGNGGELSVTQPFNIDFYEGDPDTDGVLLGTVAINSLASGTFQDVTLDNVPALAGNKSIVVVADANDSVTECNELNNTVSLPVFAGSSSAELVVSTDSTQYIAGSQVSLQGIASNTSAVPGQFIVQLQVEDAQGNIIQTFTPQSSNLLAGQATININNTWSSAGTLTGIYQLRGQLSDLNNTLISNTTTSFSLISAVGQAPGQPPGQTVTTLRTNTDKPLYHTSDRVHIDNLISNNSADSIVNNAQLRIDISNASNTVVFTQTITIPTLTAGGRLQQGINYNFTGEAEGNYTVKTQLLMQQNIVLSSAQTSYTVKSDVIKSLAAQTSVQSTTLYIGQPQVCTDNLQNTGTLDLTSLAVQQTLIDVSANQPVQTQNQTLDLATGASQTFIRNIDTASLTVGDYICAVQANIDGSLRTLDFSAFTMAVPPISAEGDLRLGSRGQLLVWFEASHVTENEHDDEDEDDKEDRDDDSDEEHNLAEQNAEENANTDTTQNNPTLDAQREYLKNLLDENGWAYTLVDNQNDFAVAFSSGQYQAYLLLNRNKKLDKLLGKSLREAIYRGEGLVLITGNNNEESKLRDSLQETLGIRLRKNTTATNRFNFVNNNPLNMDGSIIFDETKPVQEITLRQAQAVVEYEQQASSDDSPDSDNDNHDDEHNDDDENDHDSYPPESVSNATAVSFNQYGQGRALYAGFDVLAYAQQYQDKTLLQDLIKQALIKTHPVELAQSPSAVVPIKVSIQNTGSDAVIQATLSAPEASTWLRALDGVISNTDINWQYPALTSTERELTAWLQLPENGGDISIKLLTQAGLDENTPIDQNTATQTISVTTPVTLNSIITQIEDLQTQGYKQKTLKKALKSLNKALDYENENKLSRASKEAIDATGKLRKETNPAIIDARLQIDAWLRLALLRDQGGLFLDDGDDDSDE